MRRQKTGKSFANLFQTQMLYFMPVFMTLIFLKLPSAWDLYLIISTVFSILQQKIAKRELDEYEKRRDEKTN